MNPKSHASSQKFATLRIFALSVGLFFTSQAVSPAAGPDGNVWVKTPVEVGNTTPRIDQISVVNDNFVVASGSGQRLLRYTDGAWEEFPGWIDYKANNTPFGTWTDTTNLYTAAVSETEVWIGSYANQGNNLQWDGTTFTTDARGSSRRVRSMAAFTRPEGSVIMFGLTNPGGSNPLTTIQTIRNNTNDEPPTVQSIMENVRSGAGSATITGVSGYSTANMLAVGGDYLYRSVNGGSSYTEYTRPGFATGTMRAVYAYDETSALAATGDGNLLLWDTENEFGTGLLHDFDFVINSIYATDLNHIWVAGNGGNLWFYDGTTAFQVDLGITTDLNTLSGIGTDTIWVAGANGEIFRTIPEPSSLLLSGLAGMGLWAFRRPRRR